MNKTKDFYTVATSHRSIRRFKPDTIPELDLKKILEVAIAAPSSVNGQQWSVIVIKDSATKDKLADLTGIGAMTRQEWVNQCPVFLLFVMDYYKIGKQLDKLNSNFGHIDSIEATMVGCVDIGIASSNAMNLAESMGYGTVAIGGVRGKPLEIVELLGLPKGTYPILGVCLGVPDQDPALKPRLPFEAIVHQERYNKDTDSLVEQYDLTMKDYLDKRSKGRDIRTWSETCASYYSKAYYPFQKETLEKQGFKNKF